MRVLFNLLKIGTLVSIGWDFVHSGKYAYALSHEGQISFMTNVAPWIVRFLRVADAFASTVPELYAVLFFMFSAVIYSVALGVLRNPTVPEKWLSLVGFDTALVTGAVAANWSGVPTRLLVRSQIVQLGRAIEYLKTEDRTKTATQLAFSQQIFRWMGLHGSVANVPITMIDTIMYVSTIVTVTMVLKSLSLIISDCQSYWKSRYA